MIKKIIDKRLTGERALFNSSDLNIENCIFADGESPLKESKNIFLDKTYFQWKYPLWYCENIKAQDCVFKDMARAGIWYTKNIILENSLYEAPKGFRRTRNIKLNHVDFQNAEETFWNCKDIELNNISANGNYFAMNCENIKVNNLNLTGNYSFDGCNNLEISNSKLLSKDAFWNCENVMVINCYICGEYLAWNSKNISFINCRIESLQGMCYVKNLVLKDTKLLNTNLAFEYSSINADISGKINSVKNPESGIIRAGQIDDLILEKNKIDPSKTKIILDNNKINNKIVKGAKKNYER